MADPSSKNQRIATDQLALFYHRDTRNAFHGSAAYVRDFVRFFQTRVKLTVVSPGGGALIPQLPTTLPRDLFLGLISQVVFLMRPGRILNNRQKSILVVAEPYSGLVPVLLAKICRMRLVYLCNDLHEEYSRSWSKIGSRRVVMALRKATERLVIGNSSCVVVRTEVMKLTLQARYRGLEVVVARHRPWRRPIDERAVKAIAEKHMLEGRLGLVFVGNCHYLPNKLAAKYIAEHLAPRIRRQHPDVTFVLVGPGTESISPSSGGNVISLGVVHDLSSILYSCHLGLAPMRVEGGVSSKVIDYLAHGLEVVATPEAAIGQPLTDRLHVADMASFEELVDRWISAPAHRTGCQVLKECYQDEVQAALESPSEWLNLGRVLDIALP